MKRKKYMMSGGLAFSEEKDMEKLRKLSQKGWHVSGFSFMGYTLEKGENQDFVYSVDYRSLNDGEKEEYIDLFSASGWSHIASENDFHLFRALPGTQPIYTDRDTTVEKYAYSTDTMKGIALSVFIITGLLWLGSYITGGIIHSILSVLAMFFTVIAMPTAYTLVATYYQKWKAEEKTRLVNLVKIAVLLFLTGGIVLLLLIDSSSPAIKLIAYMMIGAIGLPTAIWGIMSLRTKFVEHK